MSLRLNELVILLLLQYDNRFVAREALEHCSYLRFEIGGGSDLVDFFG